VAGKTFGAVEFFADVAISHKKTFEFFIEMAAIGASDPPVTRLEDAPCADKARIGQILPQSEFESRYKKSWVEFYRTLLKGFEGELLALELEMTTVPEHERHHALIPPVAFHVQYAKTQEQRTCMTDQGLPGTMRTYKHRQGIKMSRSRLREIGSTSVCEMNPPGVVCGWAQAKVLTWPQLFFLGMKWGFSPMEIFLFGMSLERILTVREHPHRSEMSQVRHDLELGHKGRSSSQPGWSSWSPWSESDQAEWERADRAMAEQHGGSWGSGGWQHGSSWGSR
jgi:hypothetical protein